MPKKNPYLKVMTGLPLKGFPTKSTYAVVSPDMTIAKRWSGAGATKHAVVTGAAKVPYISTVKIKKKR